MVLIKTNYDMGDMTSGEMGSLIGSSMAADADTRTVDAYTMESNTSCDGLEFGPEIKAWTRWLIYQPYLRASLLWTQYQIDRSAFASTQVATRTADQTYFHETENIKGQSFRLSSGIAFCPMEKFQILVEYAFSLMQITQRVINMSYQHRDNRDNPNRRDAIETDAGVRVPTLTFATGIAIAF